MTKKTTDLEAKWKRALADYQNLEKRVAREQADFIKFSTASFIAKLLPILDDLDRATQHLKDPGLELIVSHFQDILKSAGVTEVEALHQPFNHTTMEAVDTVAGKKDTVVAVIAKGYQLHDKILRPARVTVGKG